MLRSNSGQDSQGSQIINTSQNIVQSETTAQNQTPQTPRRNPKRDAGQSSKENILQDETFLMKEIEILAEKNEKKWENLEERLDKKDKLEKKKKIKSKKKKIEISDIMHEDEYQNAVNMNDRDALRSLYNKKITQYEKECEKLRKKIADLKIKKKKIQEARTRIKRDKNEIKRANEIREARTGIIIDDNQEIGRINELKDKYLKRIKQLEEQLAELQRANQVEWEVMQDNHLDNLENTRSKFNKLKRKHQDALVTIKELTILDDKPQNTNQVIREEQEIVKKYYSQDDFLKVANEAYKKNEEEQIATESFNLFVKVDQTNTINQLQKTNEDLENEKTNLKEKNIELTEQRNFQTGIISTLTNQNNAQKQSIDKLQMMISQLQAQLKTQEMRTQGSLTNLVEQNNPISNPQMETQIEQSNVLLMDTPPNIQLQTPGTSSAPPAILNQSLTKKHKQCKEDCDPLFFKEHKDDIWVKATGKSDLQKRKFSTYLGYEVRFADNTNEKATLHQKKYHTNFFPNGDIFVNGRKVRSPFLIYADDNQPPVLAQPEQKPKIKPLDTISCASTCTSSYYEHLIKNDCINNNDNPLISAPFIPIIDDSSTLQPLSTDNQFLTGYQANNFFSGSRPASSLPSHQQSTWIDRNLANFNNNSSNFQYISFPLNANNTNREVVTGIPMGMPVNNANNTNRGVFTGIHTSIPLLNNANDTNREVVTGIASAPAVFKYTTLPIPPSGPPVISNNARLSTNPFINNSEPTLLPPTFRKQ